MAAIGNSTPELPTDDTLYTPNQVEEAFSIPGAEAEAWAYDHAVPVRGELDGVPQFLGTDILRLIDGWNNLYTQRPREDPPGWPHIFA